MCGRIFTKYWPKAIAARAMARETHRGRDPAGEKAERRMKNHAEKMVFAAGTRQRGPSSA